MNSKFRNFLGVGALFVMALGIPITIIILTNQTFDYKINAFLNDNPKSVKVLDIRGNFAKIVWITEKEVTGIVRIGNSDTLYKDKDSTSFHVIQVGNLTPNQKYTFSIFSDGNEYKSNDYVINTVSVAEGSEDPFVIYGQIFDKDGVSLQKNGLVLLTLSSSGSLSQELPATINNAGGFTIDLANILNSTGDQKFNYKKSLEISLKIYSDVTGIALEKKFTINFSIQRQIPNIYLGDVNIDIMPGINGD